MLPAVVKVKSGNCHGAKKVRGWLGIPKGGETKVIAIRSKVHWVPLPNPTKGGCSQAEQLVELGVHLGPECCPVF